MKSTKSFFVFFVLSSFIVLVQCQFGRQKKQKAKVTESNVCQLDADPGGCYESIRRFYFDATSGECRMFQWTGCDGNANRFNSKRICEKKCRAEKGTRRCPPVSCDADLLLSCRFGRAVDVNGCETCACKENPRCSQEKCFLTCPFGNVEDEHGCKLCECLPPAATKCYPVSCHMRCEHGFKHDDDGCKTCECRRGVGEEEEEKEEERQVVDEDREEEIHTCSRVRCAMHCELGFVKDRYGCDVCQCVEAPTVPTTPRDKCGLRPMCAMYCPLGFQKDSYGCSVCRCVEPPPPPPPTATTMRAVPVDRCSLRPVCRMHCSDGFVKDSDGCDRCECARRAPTPPPPPTAAARAEVSCPSKAWFWCLKLCAHGYAKGPDGCDVCQCHVPGEERQEEEEMRKEEEDEEETSQTEREVWNPEPEPERRPYCSPVRCRMYCKHGFQTDDQGCEICKCREVDEEEEEVMPSSCSPVTCYMYCEHGFAKDARGCDVCRCAAPPSTPAPPQQQRCQGRPTCRMFCPYGYERDAGGCDRCVCYSPEDSIDYARARQVKARCSADDDRRCRKQCYERGFKTDADGCMLCECADDGAVDAGPKETDRLLAVDTIIADARKSSCSLPPEVGPCRASIERWHYNPRARRCETFRYGGCRGNANNFLSEKSCIKYCKPEVNQEPTNWKTRYFRMIGML